MVQGEAHTGHLHKANPPVVLGEGIQTGPNTHLIQRRYLADGYAADHHPPEANLKLLHRHLAGRAALKHPTQAVFPVALQPPARTQNSEHQGHGHAQPRETATSEARAVLLPTHSLAPPDADSTRESRGPLGRLRERPTAIVVQG